MEDINNYNISGIASVGGSSFDDTRDIYGTPILPDLVVRSEAARLRRTVLMGWTIGSTADDAGLKAMELIA